MVSMSDTLKNSSIQQKITHLHNNARDAIATKHKKAWASLQDSQIPIQHFVEQTGRFATSIALAGSLLIPKSAVPPQNQDSNPNHTQASVAPIDQPQDPQLLSQRIVNRTLSDILPDKPQRLDASTSQAISTTLEQILHIKAYSELDGNTLNTDYGYMGAEQHLPRFAGDTIAQHDEYQSSGITKHRGAFGYFAPSKGAMTEETIQQEKYYVAVQSFLAPQWNQNSRAYKNWLAFRKVLVVNPQTGKAVVGVVGDAGPAQWTGKQFGGSPEVIRELNNGKHSAKTTVILLFVDDPENTVPLGPVN